jgi:hypothetical protein
MKMPFKGDTAAKLVRAEDDLTACELAVTDLRRDRDALLSDGEAAEIEKLDRKIVDYERQAAVFRERIPLLQARLAAEQAEQRKRDYTAAVNKIASRLPGLSKAAQELESALLAIPRALLKFQAEQRSVLQSYPDNVERPFTSEFGLDRVERILHECFRPFGPEWTREAREGWDINRKLENIKEVVSEFSKAETAGYEALITRLRERAPQSEPESEAA